MALQRPALYVPVSVHFATGRTGSAILGRYGVAGLGVWGAMLAAAKAHRPEGRLTFAHEEDWAAIGLAAHRPDFQLREFLAFLGRRKQTRTTLHGRVMYVELTRWKEWNQTQRRETDRLRKSRKRGDSIPDTLRTESGQEADALSREAEQEKESYRQSEASYATPAKKPQGRHERLGTLDERYFAVEALLGVLPGADPDRIRFEAADLPAAQIQKVRESVMEAKARGDVKNLPGYAVKALRSEVGERSAA